MRLDVFCDNERNQILEFLESSSLRSSDTNLMDEELKEVGRDFRTTIEVAILQVYEIQSIKGKHKGLVALKDIETGPAYSANLLFSPRKVSRQ